MGSMQNGVWVPALGGRFGGRAKVWRDKAGKTVTDTKAYTPGGISAGMSADEVDDVKKRRGRRGQTAIESETLGGGR